MKAKFAELEESSKKAIAELESDTTPSTTATTTTKSKKNKKKKNKKEHPKEETKQEEPQKPLVSQPKTVVISSEKKSVEPQVNSTAQQQKKKPQNTPPAATSAWNKPLNNTSASPKPTEVATTAIEKTVEPAEEFSQLQKTFLNLHPMAEDLDLRLGYYIGLDLQKLSMEQLTALEQIHYKAVQSISEAKIELIRNQERLRLEEEMSLQQQKRNVIERSRNKS